MDHKTSVLRNPCWMMNSTDSSTDNNLPSPVNFMLNSKARIRNDASAILRISSHLNSGPEPSQSELLNLILYDLGLISAHDLSYYLGISAKTLEKFLKKGLAEANLKKMRYPSSRYRTFYSFFIDQAPFSVYAKEKPCQIPFVFNTTGISIRTLAHAYTTSLSKLQIELYFAEQTDCEMDSYCEIPLGNGKLIKSRKYTQGDVVTDLVTFIRNNSKANTLFVESDMGTESYKVLFEKILGYANADILIPGRSETFKLICSMYRFLPRLMSAGTNVAPRSRYLAFLAALITISTLNNPETPIEEINLENIESTGGFHQYFADSLAVQNIMYSSINTLKKLLENYGIYDITASEWEEIRNLHSSPDNFKKIKEELYSISGFMDPFGHRVYNKFPASILIDFIRNYDCIDAETLEKIQTNSALYKASLAKHYGFARHILHRIVTAIEELNIYHSSDKQMLKKLEGIYAGCQWFDMPTSLISNYMPYVFWRTEHSGERKLLEEGLKKHFETIVLKEKSFPVKYNKWNGEGCLKYWYSCENTANDIRNLVLEYVDCDLFGLIRVILFLLYGDYTDDMKLLLLFDYPNNTRKFLTLYRHIKEFAIGENDVTTKEKKLLFLIKPSAYPFQLYSYNEHIDRMVPYKEDKI